MELCREVLTDPGSREEGFFWRVGREWNHSWGTGVSRGLRGVLGDSQGTMKPRTAQAGGPEAVLRVRQK